MPDTDRDISLNDHIEKVEKQRDDLLADAINLCNWLEPNDEGGYSLDPEAGIHVVALENTIARVKRRMT